MFHMTPFFESTFSSLFSTLVPSLSPLLFCAKTKEQKHVLLRLLYAPKWRRFVLNRFVLIFPSFAIKFNGKHLEVSFLFKRKKRRKKKTFDGVAFGKFNGGYEKNKLPENLSGQGLTRFKMRAYHIGGSACSAKFLLIITGFDI